MLETLVDHLKQAINEAQARAQVIEDEFNQAIKADAARAAEIHKELSFIQSPLGIRYYQQKQNFGKLAKMRRQEEDLLIERQEIRSRLVDLNVKKAEDLEPIYHKLGDLAEEIRKDSQHMKEFVRLQELELSNLDRQATGLFMGAIANLHQLKMQKIQLDEIEDYDPEPEPEPELAPVAEQKLSAKNMNAHKILDRVLSPWIGPSELTDLHN